VTNPVCSTTVVITMAGEGSRFRQAGYTVPKYEVVAHGRSLFAWSMESLRGFADAGCEFVFVARAGDHIGEFIAQQCEAAGIRDFRVVTLDALTDGQATTAMLAKAACSSPDAPIAIYNIDTYVDPASLDLTTIRGQGWIPCFRGEGDKWSFAAADPNGRVSEVREKKRISPHATVGLYWFASFELFSAAYQTYYSRPEHLEAKERYIAPLYNQLIQDGADVYMHEIPAEDVYPLGTPEDVQAFERRPVVAHASAVAR
jgi:NDP-sugar pyrophosphorylase family protein